MRKKILLPLLFLAMMSTFTACNDTDSISGDDDDRITISTDTTSKDESSDDLSTEDGNSEVVTYEVKTEHYERDNISIEYPVLEGNIPNIDTLNKTIYDENMEGIEYLTDSYTYDQTIEMKEQSDEILSILCQAYNMYSSASHPVALFSTINIDVKTGTLIEFEESNLDEFSKKINNREFEIVDLMEGIEVEEAKDEIIMHFNLSSGYPMFYIQDGIYHYVMSVNHALGDYMTITLTTE
ncbi:MAG: hypothetical protein IJA10_15750 [Lachnospiraceae bacterium]|nr:hypothetical protein [Lachnospiraceae bacterium]